MGGRVRRPTAALAEVSLQTSVLLLHVSVGFQLLQGYLPHLD